MGRIICELERIYGVRQGSAGKSDVPMELGKTQNNIADELNIDINSYKRYKKLTTLIPELQEMVDSDSLTTTNL